MLYKLDDYWKKEILKAQSLITQTKKKDDCGDFVHIGDDIYIEVENLLGWIEELDYELEHSREEYEDLQNDLESNYKPISQWEQSGMSYRDFI